MGIIEGSIARGAGVERGPGADWYVDAESGSDASGGGSWSSAFASIGAAITAASAGDRIWIATGGYDENVVVAKDYLTLIGADEGGYAKPDLAPAAGLALVVSGQGAVLRHLRFAGAGTDVVRISGNGFLVEDCVVDGDGNSAGLLRLKGHDTDDSKTASEGIVRNVLFRGSGGGGVIFDTAEPTVGVGSTDCLFEDCVFIENTGPDLSTEDTGPGTYSMQRARFRGCSFAGPKNKATWVDFTTANGGAAGDQSGVLEGCYFHDDNVDGTAVKAAGTGVGLVGCYSLDGLVDGSALD